MEIVLLRLSSLAVNLQFAPSKLARIFCFRLFCGDKHFHCVFYSDFDEGIRAASRRQSRHYRKLLPTLVFPRRPPSLLPTFSRDAESLQQRRRFVCTSASRVATPEESNTCSRASFFFSAARRTKATKKCFPFVLRQTGETFSFSREQALLRRRHPFASRAVRDSATLIQLRVHSLRAATQ